MTLSGIVSTTKIVIFQFQHSETVLIHTVIKNTFHDLPEMNDFASRIAAFHLRSINIVKAIAESFIPEATSFELNDIELTIGMKATTKLGGTPLTAAK
jgi:D-mannonate dehydratase